jgi:oxysterol-binding protein-related protein 9/10/11
MDFLTSIGTLTISVSESCFLMCPQTKTKAIITYVEEGWLGKAQNRVEGVMFTYDPENDVKNQKVRDVPEKDVLGRIEGSWMDKIYYSLGSGSFASAEVGHPSLQLTVLILPGENLAR